MRLPVSLMPELEIPVVAIQISVPGWTAEEIDRQIVNPMRRILLECDHLEDINTSTSGGQSLVELTFTFGTSMQEVFWQVNEKTDRVWSALPREIDRPIISRVKASDLPILRLNVYQAIPDDSDLLQLSEYVTQGLALRLEQLPEIAVVDITGNRDRQLQLKLDPISLANKGLLIQDIANSLRASNSPMRRFSVTDNQYEYVLTLDHRLSGKENIENIRIESGERMYGLMDLATISEVAQPLLGSYLANGQPGIGIAIMKKPEASVESLREAVETILADESSLHPDIRFMISEDQGLLLEDSLGGLIQSLWIAGIMVFVVLLFFFNSWRSPWIMAVSLVFSLLVSLLGFYLLDLSFNLISISGLILGIGLMIDNGIIVLDNILRSKEGRDLSEAAYLGSAEVVRPLLSSMLTTIVVFLPLTLIPGMGGMLFQEQAIAISLALGASYLSAILVIPSLVVVWKKSLETPQRSLSTAENVYEKFAGAALRWKKAMILGAIGLCAVATWIAPGLEVSRLPALPSSAVMLTISWNEPIAVAQNQNRLQGILAELEDIEMKSTSELGIQSFVLEKKQRLQAQQARIWLSPTSQGDLDRITERLSLILISQYPSATFHFASPPDPLSLILGEELPEYILACFSQESTTYLSTEILASAARFLEDSMNIPTSPMEIAQTIEIQILPEKLLFYDISNEAVIQTLSAALDGFEVLNITTGRRPIPVTIAHYSSTSFSELTRGLFVSNAQNDMTPIDQLISLSRLTTFQTIRGDGQGAYIGLIPNLTQQQDVQWATVLRQLEQKFPMRLQLKGQHLSNQHILEPILWGLLVGVFLLLAILTVQFESFRLPLIILSEVPVTIGMILSIWWVMGISVNVMSLIGIILVTGIMINDSILKIGTVQQLESNGRPRDLAITEGGKIRFRPIIMTSLTTIFAAIPILIGSGLGNALQQPLALTIIIGMVVGTLVSLFYVPVLYALMAGKRGTP